jgi:hypothetical protein
VNEKVWLENKMRKEKVVIWWRRRGKRKKKGAREGKRQRGT